MLRLASGRSAGSGNTRTRWVRASTRTIALRPPSVTQAAPPGPTITPCGADPAPSGISSTSPVRGSSRPSSPVCCAVYQTRRPSRAGATSCGCEPAGTGNDFSRTRARAAGVATGVGDGAAISVGGRVGDGSATGDDSPPPQPASATAASTAMTRMDPLSYARMRGAGSIVRAQCSAARTSATSRSSPTSTTARRRWSTPCCGSPAPSAPTRTSTSASWTRWTSSARRASRSSPRTPRSSTATSSSTSSTRPATRTSAARWSGA